MKAHDLGFGADPEELRTNTLYGSRLPGTGAIRAGWTGAWGPDIGHHQWPRSPTTGLPMRHELTLYLPQEYQRRGPASPAIAFFSAGNFTEVPPATPPVPDPGSDDPFLRELAECRPHRQATVLTDIIDGKFTLIWLSDNEFRGGPTPPPPDVRPPAVTPGGAHAVLPGVAGDRRTQLRDRQRPDRSGVGGLRLGLLTLLDRRGIEADRTMVRCCQGPSDAPALLTKGWPSRAMSAARPARI